jgi:hypothetical protein
MHFGKWIIVAFIIFATFIATLVTVCMREDISLVSKEYYKEELAYQYQLAKLNNTATLDRQPIIKIVNNNLEITFNQPSKIENASLKLFCPSNTSYDKRFPLTNNNTQKIPITSLPKKMYKAQLTWKMDNKEYYLEEMINI